MTNEELREEERRDRKVAAKAERKARQVAAKQERKARVSALVAESLAAQRAAEEAKATREHMTSMAAAQAEAAERRQLRDHQFALDMVAALTPLALAIGAGITKLQENAIRAQGARLEAERDIAARAPKYAKERVKLFAATGKLWTE